MYAQAEAEEARRARQQQRRQAPSKLPIVLICLGLVALLIVGVVGKFCLDLALMPKAPVLADTRWQTFEEGRITMLLPGPPVYEKNMDIRGHGMRTIRAEPTPKCFFMVDYLPSALPVRGKSFSVDGLLNAGLDGSRDYVARFGCNELYRKDVQLNSMRGKELVMTLPETKGTFIVRNYFHNGRMFIVIVGGEGMLPDHPDITKFLVRCRSTRADLLQHGLGFPCGQDVRMALGQFFKQFLGVRRIPMLEHGDHEPCEDPRYMTKLLGRCIFYDVLRVAGRHKV